MARARSFGPQKQEGPETHTSWGRGGLRRTMLVSGAPPLALKCKQRRNRLVHWSSLVGRPKPHRSQNELSRHVQIRNHTDPPVSNPIQARPSSALYSRTRVSPLWHHL